MVKKLIRLIIVLAVVSLLAVTAASAIDVDLPFDYPIMGGIVNVSSALNLRSEPNTSSNVLAKLPNETRICVIGEDGNWYKAVYNGIKGYVSADYVSIQPIMNITTAGAARVKCSALNVRSGPSTQNAIIDKLYEGETVEVIGINNGWFKIMHGGAAGYISCDYVELTSEPVLLSQTNQNASLREQIVQYAYNFLGIKYVYGGTTTKGFDCSGLTQYIYAHFGYSIQRSSYNQYAYSVKKISKSQLQPGDLVFFSNDSSGNNVGHVGIYIGNGMFIHAPRTGSVVKIESLDSSYYVKHWIGGGSVLDK